MKPTILICALGVAFAAPALAQQAPTTYTAADGYGATPALPAPDTSHKVQHFSTQTQWPEGKLPTAPKGFTVTSFAGELDSPRWLYVLENGDVLVAEARTKPKATEKPEDVEKSGNQRKSGTITGGSPDRITLLRDTNRDGRADERHVLLDGLNQPFGMVVIGDALFVGNTDGVMRYPFKTGQTRIDAAGEKIVTLPAGGYNNHWTRNLTTNRDRNKLLISVGSASNVGEHGMDEEKRRANILETDLDGKNERVFAAGLRNPNGMDWEPTSGALWTAVNERDNLGDALVPDYITSVQDGGFYGWPYSYWGKHPDPRLKGEGRDLVERAITPDYALGAHTASLGLTFYRGDAFPQAYRSGAYVGQRGSWNNSTFVGYKVVFVPFKDGKPSGAAQDFLTGFMADAKTGETYGRPVGVVQDAAGALLVADDTGNRIWRVSAQ